MTRRSGIGRRVVGLAGTLALVGCAGSTFGSGVGDARFEHAPYYAGARSPGAGEAGDGAVAWLPIGYQPGASQPAIFDPPGEGAVALLLEEMNRWLDSVAVAGMSGLGERVRAPAGDPPDVRFGCETDGWDECAFPEADDGFGPGSPRMLLTVGRPSDAWTAAAASEMARAGASSLLVLTLEVGQYWPRQTDWKGSKAVELGTDRIVSLPWLTGLDTPLTVLQVTGALMGPDGRAIRIGAEGLLARRTSIVPGGFGLQALITDEEVQALLRGEGMREWRDALGALLAELAGGRSG